MANLKLTEYTDATETYTFPYNPNSIEFVNNKLLEQRSIPYFFTFLGMTTPIKSSITIGLNGHFDGATKNTDFRSLTVKVNKPVLLKLYFENTHDKFYLCTGTNVQKVPTGSRPLHIDYVANFFSPFGILFDDTQQDGLQASTKSNDGDILTPIEKITGEVLINQVVEISDGNGNGFKFTASQSGTMTYNIVKIITEDNDIYYTEYGYVEVDDGAGTVERQAVLNANSTGSLYLALEPDQTLTNLFSGGTISNITPTFYFRNGWSSD